MSDSSSISSNDSTPKTKRSHWRHLLPVFYLMFTLAALAFWGRAENWLMKEFGFSEMSADLIIFLACLAVLLIWPMTALLIHLRKQSSRPI